MNGEAAFLDVGVFTYYRHGRLSWIAVDALTGPQVDLDGTRLVGRVPSQVEAAIDAYAAKHEVMFCYDATAAFGLPELGLILRVQRAGDFVLTRPVFVPYSDPAAWEHMPTAERNRF